jgi:uncharacterized membrane protein YhaH (DUF805 family)
MRRATDIRRIGQAFDPRGRMSAPTYRHFTVRAILYGAVLLCLAIWLAALGARASSIAVVAALGVLGLVALAATARRLHDRGRSAGWLVAWGVVQALGFAPLDRWADTEPALVLVVLMAMVGFSAWFVIETLLRAGESRSNRFGPSSV